MTILPAQSDSIHIKENTVPEKPFACIYTGKVLQGNRPSTFNKIWITGISTHNKHFTLKDETDHTGQYHIALLPGKYQIQVYGRTGEIAKTQFKVDCSKVTLPDIVYKD